MRKWKITFRFIDGSTGAPREDSCEYTAPSAQDAVFQHDINFKARYSDIGYFRSRGHGDVLKVELAKL